MNGCAKCNKVCGLLMLLAGILFLLRDLAIWDFWGVQWWTVLFLLFGIGGVAGSSCKECQKMKK